VTVAARYVTGVGWAATQPLPGGSALRRFLDQPYRAHGASARGDARHACSGWAARAVASRSRLGSSLWAVRSSGDPSCLDRSTSGEGCEAVAGGRAACRASGKAAQVRPTRGPVIDNPS
jgi:hypothetical protein